MSSLITCGVSIRLYTSATVFSVQQMYICYESSYVSVMQWWVIMIMQRQSKRSDKYLVDTVELSQPCTVLTFILSNSCLRNSAQSKSEREQLVEPSTWQFTSGQFTAGQFLTCKFPLDVTKTITHLASSSKWKSNAGCVPLDLGVIVSITRGSAVEVVVLCAGFVRVSVALHLFSSPLDHQNIGIYLSRGIILSLVCPPPRTLND